jgi:hypothetical protein
MFCINSEPVGLVAVNPPLLLTYTAAPATKLLVSIFSNLPAM